MKFKSIFLYALAMALMTFLLNLADYQFYIRDLKIEAYLVLIALVFAGFGAWIAFSFVGLKSDKNKVSSKQIKHSIVSQNPVELSERELDVLMGIAEGLSNQEIAEKLHLSLSTVKTHNSNLFAKLDVKRRTQALNKAKEVGILNHSIEESPLVP